VSNEFDTPSEGLGLSNLFERVCSEVSNEFDTPI